MLLLTKRERLVMDALVYGFSERVAAEFLEMSIKNLQDATWKARRRNNVKDTKRLVFIHRMEKAGFEVMNG